MIEDKDFFSKEWKQHCGNTLILTGKREKRNKTWYYEYIFKETNSKGYAKKCNIINGNILDEKLIQKEEQDFLKGEYKQHCGNILVLTGKNNGLKRNKKKYEYIFRETNFKGYAAKCNILRGEVFDSSFEVSENKFLISEHKQNCGNILVLTGNKEKKSKYWYYEYIFKETNSKGWASKFQILKGGVLDPLSHCSYTNEENTFRSFIEFKFPNLKIFKFNGKKEDNYYEIDIFIPSLKIGFEYNGSYWHNLREKEEPGYHERKFKHFQSKGIIVFNIWDYFWFEDKKHTKIRKEAKIFVINIMNNFLLKLTYNQHTLTFFYRLLQKIFVYINN